MRSIIDYGLVLSFLERQYTQKVYTHPAADDLAEILGTHPKLVCAINHGGPHAPVAAIIGLYESYLKNGGGARKPVIVILRAFYKIPGIRLLARFMTQADHGLSAEEFAKKLAKEGHTDLLVFPEGENCVFSNGSNIVPFLSPRFIELALIAKCPVLVVVYSGAEELSTVHELSDREVKLLRWLPKHNYDVLKETKTILQPRPFKRNIATVNMHYRLYQPGITLADLPENKQERKEILLVESENVRQMMIKMKQELDRDTESNTPRSNRKNIRGRRAKYRRA